MTIASTISIPENKKRNILVLYLIFFLSMALTFLSPPTFAAISLMLAVCILAGIYMMRAQASDGSFVANHATFMIRTFWRMNLYLLFTSIPGIAYVILTTDYTPFKPCITYMNDHMMQVLQNWGAAQYNNLFKQCTDPFMRANLTNIMIGLFIMIFPILLYLTRRLVIGFRQALEGDLVAEDRL